MALRRMFFQLGLLAGCVAFALTLWQSLTVGQYELLPAALRALGAGCGILIFALIIYGIVERLAGTPEEKKQQ